ncbi:MAG: hypothetical protein JW839_14980 [Candidatus Lokiarchaeota archaeon]|nr:hypothetical protein [Candidatus Lokiarchaeota archaeon]
MPRRTAVFALAIACLVTSAWYMPASASINAQEGDQHPWAFGARWSFTWFIQDSPVSYDRNTRLRFTVHEIRPVLSGSAVVARKLVGNLSRELDIGEKQWYEMKSNVSFAEYGVLSEVYSLTPDAIGNSVLVLPMALTIPMWHFKIAYASVCNDTAWNITMDESALIFDAMNKTAPAQRIRIDFNGMGVVEDVLMTDVGGTVTFHMYLESTYDPNSELDTLISILTYTSIGAAITIIIAMLFKKYKINARDLLRGVRRRAAAEDAVPENAAPGSPAAAGDDA